MENTAVVELKLFEVKNEKPISSFEHAIMRIWKDFTGNENRRAVLIGMLEMAACNLDYEHVEDLLFLLNFLRKDIYNGPERRRAFYPLARLQIAGGLLADIAAHPQHYDDDERACRIADWNSICQSAWNAGPEMLRFCEKRI